MGKSKKPRADEEPLFSALMKKHGTNYEPSVIYEICVDAVEWHRKANGRVKQNERQRLLRIAMRQKLPKRFRDAIMED